MFRADYNPDQYLWEKDFTLAGRTYKRQDLEASMDTSALQSFCSLSLVCENVYLHDSSWTMLDYLFFNICSSGMRGATCCVVVIMCLRSSPKTLPFPVSYTAMETGRREKLDRFLFLCKNFTPFHLLGSYHSLVSSGIMQWMQGRRKWGCCNPSSIKYHCFHSWFFGFRLIRWWLCQPWLAWGTFPIYHFFFQSSLYLFEMPKFPLICAERRPQNCYYTFKKQQTNFTYRSLGTIYGCSDLVLHLLFMQPLLSKVHKICCWFLFLRISSICKVYSTCFFVWIALLWPKIAAWYFVLQKSLLNVPFY